MSAGKRQHRRPDSTVVSPGPGGPAAGKWSATQILSAQEARGKRAGESSVILPGERIRRSGLGVAARFALIVSAAIAAFMLVFGLVLHAQVRDALDTEIDAAGVHAAKALAAPDVSTWYLFHGAYEDTDFGGYETAIARSEKKIPEGMLTKEQIARANRRVEVNKDRLKRLLDEDARILDAVIMSPDLRSIVRIGSKHERLSFNGQTADRKQGVEIAKGSYVPPDGRQIPARSYTTPILSPAGGVAGHAIVVLSEESIQDALSAVLKRILVLTLVFVIAGVGVSWFVGSRVTEPIQSLTHDVEVIAKGDLDHRVKVGSSDEIGVLGKTIDRMARSLKAAQDAEVDHAKQKHQLSVALEIQNNLLPKSLPATPGYELEAYYRPGPEVGGDYYDVLTLPDGRLFLMVASASGKGIPAAMLTVMARSFTTALAEREPNVSTIFKAVNRLLSPDLRRGMYVTALAAVLDPKTGKVQLANAGHQAPLLFEASARAVAPVHSDGIALGFDKGPVFDRSLRETELQLQTGDRLVLFTPGVLGITDREGRELGEENFQRVVAREAQKDSAAFVKLVVHTLDQFLGGGTPESDITFLTLRRI